LPTAWMFCHANDLETAIMGGQCFFLLGFYFILAALAGNRRTLNAFLAGTCWALAVGSRLSLAPSIIVLASSFVLQLWKRKTPKNNAVEWIRAASLFCLPLVAGAALLALYNYVRFGSWTDTGWALQLAGVNNHEFAHKGVLTSLGYAGSHAVRYLFEVPILERRFPFFTLAGGSDSIARLTHPASLLNFEPVGGVLWTVPFAGFMIAAVVNIFRRKSPTGAATATAFGVVNNRWLTSSLLSAAILGIAPTTITLFSTERYLADSIPSALLLATSGVWIALRNSGDRPGRKRLVVGLALATAALSVVLGLLSACGPYGNVREMNPALFDWLAAV
jgi:hypothetical protein